MKALCQHTLLEYHGCNPSLLKHSNQIRDMLLESVRRGRGTIVTDVFHNFSPYGVSGVVVIAESHVTIHTWPEHGYAAIDIFSCSEMLDHAAIREFLRSALNANIVQERILERGAVPPSILPCPESTIPAAQSPAALRQR